MSRIRYFPECIEKKYVPEKLPQMSWIYSGNRPDRSERNVCFQNKFMTEIKNILAEGEKYEFYI